MQAKAKPNVVKANKSGEEESASKTRNAAMIWPIPSLRKNIAIALGFSEYKLRHY
jgi:hypothetical protein